MRNTLACALALFALGCGDTTSGGPDMAMSFSIPHNFDQINTEVLAFSCAAFSSCHQTKMLSTDNLDLHTDPYNALVGAPSVNAKAASQGLLRVKPCDSANSFLVIKLTLPNNLDPNTDYGAFMPYTSPHLPAEQIQAIKDWIDRGALQNEPPTVTGHTCMLGADMAGAHD